MQTRTESVRRYPTPTRPQWVRAWRVCRGLRAWHAQKVAHETEEARRVPAALTARAKQERRRNDKQRRRTNRASDWSIVSRGKAQASKLEKGPTSQRSPHRQSCSRLRSTRPFDRPELALLFEQRLDKPGQFRFAPGASVFKLAFPAVSGSALLINQSDGRPNTLLPLVPVLKF